MAKDLSKDKVVALRMTDEDLARLDALTEKTVRNRSDMVRFLINKEYAIEFTEQPQPCEER